MNGNQRKDAQLGMSHGTASNRLRKMVMFSLLERLQENVCYRCGAQIISAGDLSVEHKEPWLGSRDPIGTFFDLGNTAFSHLKCNVDMSRSRWTSKNNPRVWTSSVCERGHRLTPDNVYESPAGRRRCRECKKLRDRGSLA